MRSVSLLNLSFFDPWDLRESPCGETPEQCARCEVEAAGGLLFKCLEAMDKEPGAISRGIIGWKEAVCNDSMRVCARVCACIPV